MGKTRDCEYDYCRHGSHAKDDQKAQRCYKSYSVIDMLNSDVQDGGE